MRDQRQIHKALPFNHPTALAKTVLAQKHTPRPILFLPFHADYVLEGAASIARMQSGELTKRGVEAKCKS